MNGLFHGAGSDGFVGGFHVGLAQSGSGHAVILAHALPRRLRQVPIPLWGPALPGRLLHREIRLLFFHRRLRLVQMIEPVVPRMPPLIDPDQRARNAHLIKREAAQDGMGRPHVQKFARFRPPPISLIASNSLNTNSKNPRLV
jgi:hypothetical protein